jgi:hypothetical protein
MQAQPYRPYCAEAVGDMGGLSEALTAVTTLHAVSMLLQSSYC